MVLVFSWILIIKIKKSFIVKQSLKTIYFIKNYGSLSFAYFYHFFKSKSVRYIWFGF